MRDSKSLMRAPDSAAKSNGGTGQCRLTQSRYAAQYGHEAQPAWRLLNSDLIDENDREKNRE